MDREKFSKDATSLKDSYGFTSVKTTCLPWKMTALLLIFIWSTPTVANTYFDKELAVVNTPLNDDKDLEGKYFLQLNCSDKPFAILEHLEFYNGYRPTYIYIEMEESCQYKIIMAFDDWASAQQFRVDNPRLVSNNAFVRRPHTMNTFYSLEEFRNLVISERP